MSNLLSGISIAVSLMAAFLGVRAATVKVHDNQDRFIFDLQRQGRWAGYPRSAGRVLRYLGEMIEKEAELVIDHHLSGVLALKAARDFRATAPPVTS